MPDTADPSDMSAQYNTPLTPAEEAQYASWVAQQTKDQGRDVSADERDYDMKGFWKSGEAQAGNGHFPDTFKKPSHPTFSTESKYHGIDGNEGGSWKKTDTGWTFKPGSTNLKIRSPDQLNEYFKRSDPNVVLEQVQ